MGTVAYEIVKKVNDIAPGRVLLQADLLDVNQILPEVTTLASAFSDRVGWQSNKHGSTGAGCNGGGAGSCDPDGPTSPYFYLLKNGWQNSGTYLEVWSNDVVSYPQGIDAAVAAGYFSATAVEKSTTERPLRFELEPNYPNPFNPSTTIRYDLPQRADVDLKVFDILGREVLVRKIGPQQAGTHEVVVDFSAFSSGIYFYRLRAGDFVQTRKMTVVK